MTHDPSRLLVPTVVRPAIAAVPPVLIEVPVVATVREAPSRPSWRATRCTSARRRRLRREVRLAGYALLAGLPLTLAIPAVWGLVATPPAPERGSESATAARGSSPDAPPVVTLMLEPMVGVSAAVADAEQPDEATGPVLLPGYVLPDDGPEEASHAGG